MERFIAMCSSRACTTGAGRSPRGRTWPTAQHSRIYWYVVGKMDEWDLNDPKAEARLRTPVRDEPAAPRRYLEDASRRMPDLPLDRRIEEAWNLCFSETREWYESKRRALERKKRFYHGVQAATDFVEIRQEGHWKVDLLHHTVNEKGLDTSLAVDMVALQDTYDIALLISGDADGIPGINYVKSRSKHVGVAEFRRGSPADFPTKGTSSRLKIAADFVVQVYEAELIRRNLAYRSEIGLPAARSGEQRPCLLTGSTREANHDTPPRDRPAGSRNELRRGNGRRLGAGGGRRRDLARRPADRDRPGARRASRS